MREETKDESYQFIAVRLPYGEQADEERISSIVSCAKRPAKVES